MKARYIGSAYPGLTPYKIYEVERVSKFPVTGVYRFVDDDGDIRHRCDLEEVEPQPGIMQPMVVDLSAIPAGFSKEPIRQYFSKDNACLAMSADDADCICWYDEGTGPYPDFRSAETPTGRNWRFKPAPPQPQVIAQEAPDTRSFWKRLKHKLFPAKHCLIPEAPFTFKDCIHGHSVTKLDFADRIRVLLTGVVVSSWRTVTEKEVGSSVTTATCHIGTNDDWEELNRG